VVHLVILVTALAVSGWRGCLQKRETRPMPIEFMVAAAPPPTAAEVVTPPPVPPPPEPPKAVKPPGKPEKPKETKKPKKKKKKIRVSDKVVQRPAGPPPKKTLSDDEIKKLLARGARIGDRTTIPDDEARCLARIHDVLYTAWTDRPSAADVGDAVSKVEFGLTKDGGVKSRRMVQKSGNPTMDASVMKAAGSVVRISGLSPAFLDRHGYSVTVSFRLE